MSALIEDMLNLSRLTRGGMHRETINLSQIAMEIANSFKLLEPDREVAFDIEDNLLVQADPNLLRVVLQNLLGNAWKFTSKHSSAHIEFRRETQHGQDIYFVQDDGAGFEMEYADHLFGVFQRLHDANEFPGTGIGLASVQRIIHRHGGTVRAFGEVEKGARICFTLGEHHE